jgi:succinate dehydrogenase / fumarate reductase flavoprotein subunit
MRIHQLRQQYQDCMTEHCGVFREESTMQTGIEKLAALQEQYGQIYLDDKETLWNTEVVEALELRNLMVVGRIIMASALQRRESRGSHSREDFTSRDDANFLKHTLAYYSPAGVQIGYRDVALGMFEPQERKY